MPQIEVIRPLKLQPTGGEELTVANRGSNTIFYGRTSLVSATNNIGELHPGEAITIGYGFFVWVVNKPAVEGVLQQPAIVDLRESGIRISEETGASGFPESGLFPSPSLFPS